MPVQGGRNGFGFSRECGADELGMTTAVIPSAVEGSALLNGVRLLEKRSCARALVPVSVALGEHQERGPEGMTRIERMHEQRT